MTLVVVAAPVPPDKVEQHRRMLDELHGSRRTRYEALHRQAGVRERGYMQPTPAGGYLYLVAWEGEGDPATLVQRLVQAGQADADFAQWFFPQSQAVFGIDASQGLPPLPAQVIDSGPL
jgi:hypothetical protein